MCVQDELMLKVHKVTYNKLFHQCFIRIKIIVYHFLCSSIKGRHTLLLLLNTLAHQYRIKMKTFAIVVMVVVVLVIAIGVDSYGMGTMTGKRNRIQVYMPCYPTIRLKNLYTRKYEFWLRTFRNFFTVKRSNNNSNNNNNNSLFAIHHTHTEKK